MASTANSTGATVNGPVGQGEWLKRLGIDSRADRLIASNPAKSQEIRASLERLCAKEQMGELFKVIAIRGPGWPEPAGFAP